MTDDEAKLLDRLLEAYYGAFPHPETIKLTHAQAERINYEMHPNGLRAKLERGSPYLVLGQPVEWVEDEADSILGQAAK